MEKYNAIIFAGRTERDNVLCEMENVSNKGFIKLGDKIFLERIVEEFVKCEEIGDIYISGIAEEDWETNLPVTFSDDQSSLFKEVQNVNKKYITKKENFSEIVVLHSCDGPLVTAEIISRLIKRCKEASGGELDGFFYYSFIKNEVMERKFPNSKRTYAKFKEFEVCGGDVIIINTRKMRDYQNIIDNLNEKRKSVLAQIIILNPFLIIQYLLKRLSIYKFMKSVNRRIFKVEKGVYAVLSDDAEIAMDVDKPHQLEEVRRYYNENKDIYD